MFHFLLYLIIMAVAKENEDNTMADGIKCWQKDVLNLDAEWMSVRTTNAVGQHHHHHHHHRHQYLPELEPLRTEMRPPYGIQSANHQVTVKMTIAYGGTAHLPCPVRQLGNKTVSYPIELYIYTIICIFILHNFTSAKRAYRTDIII